jgi:DNA-binding MarR family transcriptional regulator
MNPIPDIKRFVLRALWRLNGLPWPDALMDEAVRQALVPRPLQSDIHQAKRELESNGFIQGSRDDLDESITWTLTDKGRHKAKQLG